MKKLIFLSIASVLFLSLLSAQGNQPNIDKVEKKSVIDALCENIDREYMFPEITKKYLRMLKDNFKAGKYDSITNPKDFADEITNNLMAIHRDDHLSVRYNPEWIKNKKNRTKLDEKALQLKERQDRSKNYGFHYIKILPGNIGYLKLNEFSYNENAYPTAIAAMGFLADTDALIIDLRDNGGGAPEMVQFLCSYFFDSRKHLNSFSYKDKEKLTQYWTYFYLPGKRLDKVDLYLLTSSRTFSAAEEFAYNLKNMKRATVIGETTGGGAHDNKYVILTDNFMMSLPFARAINPVTKTNWEGVGVEPDVKVSRDIALETAQVSAIEKLAEKEKDPKFKVSYLWHHEAYKTKLNPVTVDKTILHSYVGTYGPRKITMEGCSLFYKREDGPKMKMIPVAEDYFMFDEIDHFRLKIIKEGDQVVAVQGYTADGPSDRHPRDKNN